MAEETSNDLVILVNKKGGGGGHHSSSWKVALADLMTSLFATFLVLWLLATVGEEGRAEIASIYKYPSVIIKDPGNVNNKNRKETTGTSASIINKHGGMHASKEFSKHKAKGQKSKHMPINKLYKAVKSKLESRIGNAVTLTFVDNEIVINIKGDTLYDPGSIQASPKDEEIIMDIADVLIDSDQIVRIEGHTDDSPVGNDLIETNYDLSALRSSRIAWIFNVTGVSQERLVPKALGSAFPVATNETPEGRAKNRRVIITISDDSIFDEVSLEEILPH